MVDYLPFLAGVSIRVRLDIPFFRFTYFILLRSRSELPLLRVLSFYPLVEFIYFYLPIE